MSSASSVTAFGGEPSASPRAAKRSLPDDGPVFLGNFEPTTPSPTLFEDDYNIKRARARIQISQAAKDLSTATEGLARQMIQDAKKGDWPAMKDRWEIVNEIHARVDVGGK